MISQTAVSSSYINPMWSHQMGRRPARFPTLGDEKWSQPRWQEVHNLIEISHRSQSGKSMQRCEGGVGGLPGRNRGCGDPWPVVFGRNGKEGRGRQLVGESKKTSCRSLPVSLYLERRTLFLKTGKEEVFKMEWRAWTKVMSWWQEAHLVGTKKNVVCLGCPLIRVKGSPSPCSPNSRAKG